MPRKNKTPTHFVIEPSLLVSAVFICDGLVLGTDLLHNLVQVLLRRSIYLHVHVSGQLRSQSCQFLQVHPFQRHKKCEVNHAVLFCKRLKRKLAKSCNQIWRSLKMASSSADRFLAQDCTWPNQQEHLFQAESVRFPS